MEQEADEFAVAIGEDFSLDPQRLADNALYSKTPAGDLGPDVLDDDPTPKPSFVGCTVP